MYVLLIIINAPHPLTPPPTGTYSSRPSRRPLYHNLPLSEPSSSRCDYFCKASVTGGYSYTQIEPIETWLLIVLANSHDSNAYELVH